MDDINTGYERLAELQVTSCLHTCKHKYLIIKNGFKFYAIRKPCLASHPFIKLKRKNIFMPCTSSFSSSLFIFLTRMFDDPNS